jgi:uncharacterized protein involved in exopolysaccharide biosynthesis
MSNDRAAAFDPAALVTALAARWRLLISLPLLAGSLAVGVSFLVPKAFTSRAVFLPPQQQQSGAMAALAQLGPLAGLAGGSIGARAPTDQYVSLLQTVTVADRIIDAFGLMKAYDAEYRVDARKELSENVRIAAGRKDGLISVEVDDTDPQRAAAMANRYVDELRRLTAELALTEAQQRRVFFESQLKSTRDRLTEAQTVLQRSGFNQGALKADTRAAAEGYARLRAEVTAAQVRLQTLRRSLAESAPEVQQAVAALGALRAQLSRAEEGADNGGDGDYIGRFREYKYQETLFELFARQYEIARVDESREGALIQVVDRAVAAEKKSSPRRSRYLLSGVLAGLIVAVGWVAWRAALQPLGGPGTQFAGR